ncbi:hypothetical protein [Actibacterium pelagium]|uniref:hypothetical protein n=1 Tax=Actibacterium pelagium TaxID=2029103 RepID=UPI0027E4A8B8|nr:hypothetical protein [Actibacterium pelagium]
MSRILIIGSGPNAIEAREFDRARFDRVIAINNAWRIRPDWDEMICPDDFPKERRPDQIGASQRIVTSDDYVPAQNSLGGFVYAGGTMAFTAAYWALAHHRPASIAMIGCDMVYPNTGNTHFYGTGTADPLRDDPTLQSLEAKANRLMVLARERGCNMLNLSTDESRLTFPRATAQTANPLPPFDPSAVEAAKAREAELGYLSASGMYWKEPDLYDPSELAALDQLWLAAVPNAGGLSRPA